MAGITSIKTIILHSYEVLRKELGSKRKAGSDGLSGKVELALFKLAEKPEYEIELSKDGKTEYKILGITKEEILELCRAFSQLYKKLKK